MYTVKELKEKLKPLGKMNLFNMANELKYLSENIQDKEIIETFAISPEKMKLHLLVLTNIRMILLKSKGLSNKIDVHEYQISKLSSMKLTDGKFGVLQLEFLFEGDDIKIGVESSKQGDNFIEFLRDNFGLANESNKLKNEAEHRVMKSVKTKGKPKVTLELLNGHDQIGFKKSIFRLHEMIQLEPGEARFKVDGKWIDKDYRFIGYDRTENIKKSKADILGASAIGSLWGGAGAMAGGLAAQTGKDKSTAAILLQDKHTNKKIVLIVKCDSNILSKLSLFIPAEVVEEETTEKQSENKYEKLEKIMELKMQGILSEEEFQQEKTKILNQ